MREPFFHKMVATLDRRDGRGLSRADRQARPGRARAEGRGRALRRDARFGHAHLRRRCQAQRTAPSRARMRSASTTPTVSRSTSPPTSRASAACRSTWPGSTPPWTQQRETARAAGKFAGGTVLPAELVAQLQPTEFLGYDTLTAGGLQVVALLRDGRPVESIDAGDEAIVIARPHAVLCRIRRPGRRHRRIRRTGRALPGARHAEAGRPVPRPRRQARGRHVAGAATMSSPPSTQRVARRPY